MNTEMQLIIHDPSGEKRQIKLGSSHLSIGRGKDFSIELRDPTLPIHIGKIQYLHGQHWLELTNESPHFSILGISARNAAIFPKACVRIGETSLEFEKAASVMGSAPPVPAHSRPWITHSQSGIDVLWLTKRAAQTNLSVYLQGETGVGKEVLAQLLHAWSPRAHEPFITINCGALPLNLAETELFGHVKGAFTGADSHRTGALLKAHRGTLFLDEIGDLPMEIQVKLLRFLESGEVHPVGSDKVAHADVRIISATHKPLKALIDEGKFRKDLYFRLASIPITIPPLRERPEDIRTIANHFTKTLGNTLSPDAMRVLLAHSWPGNVRELRHAIERASGMLELDCKLLSANSFEFLSESDPTLDSAPLEARPILKLQEMERHMVLRALKISAGNRTEAAKILGVARSTLFEMLKRNKIQGPKSQLA